MNKSTVYYNRTRPEVATFIPKNIRTILDIGCGQGAFLKLVKEQTDAETWGIEMVSEVAQKNNDQMDKIVIGKVEDVLDSIPDDYFDCITLNDILEHLIEPSDILLKVKPKLSNNGIVIASIPNVRYFYNLYDLLIKKDWEYKDFGILDSTHLRFFTQKSMKRMFETAGYKIIKQVGINMINTRKFQLFNLISFFIFNDTKYLQFCCMAKPK